MAFVQYESRHDGEEKKTTGIFCDNTGKRLCSELSCRQTFSFAELES